MKIPSSAIAYVMRCASYVYALRYKFENWVSFYITACFCDKSWLSTSPGTCFC